MAAYGLQYNGSPSHCSVEEELFGAGGDEEEEEIDYEDEDDFVAQGFDQAAMQVEEEQPQRNLGPPNWIHRQDMRREEQARGARRHNVVPEEEDGIEDRVAASGAGPSGARPQRRINDSDDESSDASGDQAPGPQVVMQMVDASVMPDYNSKHLGKNITPKVPCFRQGTATNPTWMPYSDAVRDICNMRASRVLVWHVPASLFARDGTRFRHWCTPAQNTLRANQIAAILGMAFAPTSKGFLSGDHEEMQRSGDADGDSEGDGDKKNTIKRVFKYTFVNPSDNNISLPMFVIAYEELYDEALEEVTCIRVYKFIYHDNHSDSGLERNQMDENQRTFASAGMAHSQNDHRRTHLISQQKQCRALAGSWHKNLEESCGTQYVRITNETTLLQAIQHYGGRNIHGYGKPPIDFDKLPPGILTKNIVANTQGLGGTHPLSPEYVFNAKRTMAFTAGQIDFDGTPLDIHPDFKDPSKYFNEAGDFTIPDVSKSMGGFFFVVDPNVTNIFDVALPRSIYGSVCAGKHLLDLFKDEMVDPEDKSTSSASLSDMFTNMMTKRDATVLEMERHVSENVLTFDSLDSSEIERKSIRHYGEKDEDNNYLIEPRQILKDIQQQTRQVQTELIEPWTKKRSIMREQLNSKIRTAGGEDCDLMDCDDDDPRMEKLQEMDKETANRLYDVMKDLFHLHVNRIDASFQSKLERETIPSGYLAMADGLAAEIAKMPNNTASVAWAFDNEILGDDVSPFAQIWMWIGEFFEKDCFVEGRDRRILEEIFLHAFEQYGDVTFLLLLCGYKGNGKTLRTERAEAVFPPGWMTMGGPSSSKAGMNGQSDANNGKNVIYDEMLDELCDPEGSDRLEFWKQIVLKREYTYARTVTMKNPDGSDTMRTMKLKTPHDETHIVCTNYGMAFTKKGGDLSDAKFAMIDRTIAILVRSIGQNAHTDDEFRSHMAKPEQQVKLAQFRIFVCLVGATKLCIKGVPAFQPNFALANKIFDYLDKQMIVGEYNLPPRSARKSLKREENLRTMCIMNAVASVFMFKQTAVEWESGRLGSDGLPQPFRWTMLWDVVRQLRPTPELIFMAWSQSLEYNIGTASHSLAAMTAICEHFNVKIGDWLKKPVSTSSQQPAGVPDQAANALSLDADVREVMKSLTSEAISLADRKELLEGLERQRRATSQYRKFCSEDGVCDRVMNDPVSMIESVMSRLSMPADMEAEAAGSSSNTYMPLYPSCIMASAVQVAVVHSPMSIADWCVGSEVPVTNAMGCPHAGTSKGITFRNRKGNGACEWDLGWIRAPTAYGGWMDFARDVLHNNHTCKAFDFSQNGLRDLVYLLSTKDNARRCTEQPRVADHMDPSLAFTDEEGKPASDSSSKVQMRGVEDTRSKCPFEKRKESPPRHPYAKVANLALQRKIDYMANNGRLPAVMTMVSNRVSIMPPIRMHKDQDSKCHIEANYSAVVDHTKMMAEAVARCSIHPGMENEQEFFCNNVQAPENFTFSGQVPGDSGFVGKLPYSYDIMGISLTLDAMGRYYDPVGREYCQQYVDAFKDSLGLDIKFEDLPHMCMRYLGFAENNRRQLSIKPEEKRKAMFEYVEAGDSHQGEAISKSTAATVSLSLGHNASEEEIARYMKARAGSRAMSGVSGDLLSIETWIKHTCTAIKERGMVRGDDDVLISMVMDDPYQLRQRVAERASAKINSLVDKHPRMIAADADLPGDELLSQEKLFTIKNERRRKVRFDLYSTIELPDELDDLRDYAPVNIKGERHKFTYQNSRGQENEPVSNSSGPKKPRTVANSEKFEKKLKSGGALPGSKRPRMEGDVGARGKQDTRKRK